jgi:hypothetical protein
MTDKQIEAAYSAYQKTVGAGDLSDWEMMGIMDAIAAYHAAAPSEANDMAGPTWKQRAEAAEAEVKEAQQSEAAAVQQCTFVSLERDQLQVRVAELEELVHVAVDPMTLPNDMLAVFNKGNDALFPIPEKSDETSDLPLEKDDG